MDSKANENPHGEAGTGPESEEHLQAQQSNEKQPNNRAHKENNQDGHCEDDNNSELGWEMVNKNELQFCGNKYFIIRTGNTMNTHEAIINRLKYHRPDLEEVFCVDECDLILVFCPIVSRAGTDIEAALQQLHKYSDTKLTVLIALHHTFDPECVLPDCSRAANRTNTIIINCRFHEDQGLLQCPKNDDALGVVVNHTSNLVPVQGGWSGMQLLDYIFTALHYLSSWTNMAPAIQDKKKTPEPELRLVLMGTEPGKSAAGNTILGKKERNQEITSTEASLFNQQSESAQGEVAGRKLTVVDTPDWFSSEFSPENLRQDVGRCVRLSAPGPHAFLLVIPQLTGEQTKMLEKVEECFGEECWKNTMILLTVNDNCEKKAVQTLIRSGDQEVKKLVEKCEKRVYCLNIQEGEDAAQVSKLLEKIDEMVGGSGMKFYSSEVYQETESEIKRMIEKANERNAGGEDREMKEKQMEANLQKFLLPELWKYILTLKYKSACRCSEDERHKREIPKTGNQTATFNMENEQTNTSI